MTSFHILSSALFIFVVLNLFLHEIQANGQKESSISGEAFQPGKNVKTQVDWNKIDRALFSVREVYPDMGGQLTYKAEIGAFAVEGNGFDWQDESFSKKGTCEKFRSKNCAIKGYLDPLNLDIEVPPGLASEQEGTILMKLAAGRAPHMHGVTKVKNLYAIEQVKGKLTESQANHILENKKRWIKKKKIRVVADALYDAEAYPKDNSTTTIKSHESLHTAPFSYDEKRPIVNGKYFIVGDAILDPEVKLSFTVWENFLSPIPVKLKETFSATYLLKNKANYNMINEHYTFFYNVIEEGKSEFPRVEFSKKSDRGLFLHCLGEGDKIQDCKDLIKDLSSIEALKVIFLITDKIEEWRDDFTSNSKPCVLIRYDERMRSSFFFNHITFEELWFTWEMSIFDDWYPNPKIREAFDQKSPWNIDVLAIGGPVYKDELLRNTEELSAPLESNASIANARFAGMLMHFVNVKSADPDTFLHSIEHPEFINYDYVLNLTISTARPYVYKGASFSPQVINISFAQENIEHQGFAMPVFWQGGGLVNLQLMISSKIHVSPPKLDLRSTIFGATNGPKVVKMLFENIGEMDAVYEFENLVAVTLESKNGDFPRLLKGPNTLQLIATIVSPKSMDPHHENYIYNEKSPLDPPEGSIQIPSKTKVEIEIKFELPLIEETESQLYFSGYLKFVSMHHIHGYWDTNKNPLYPPLSIPYFWIYKK